jgi:hypothetical protein
LRRRGAGRWRLIGGAANEVNPEIRPRLPEQFVSLGMQTHRKFDELADRGKVAAAGARRS